MTVRVLNPPQGTFHPKLYLARQEQEIRAAVGSANLTGGLIANVESVAVLSGPRDAEPLRALWELAESWWADEAAVDWTRGEIAAVPEVLDETLLAAIRQALATRPVVPTLTDGRPNCVREITPDGVWVETQRSRRLGRPAQRVPAWMIQVAWEWLTTHGTLSNQYLLSDDGLNVKRSSFVCALLAGLPSVRVVSRRPIELALVP